MATAGQPAQVQGRVLAFCRVRPPIDFGDGLTGGEGDATMPPCVKMDKETNTARMSGFFGTPSGSVRDSMRVSQSITQKEFDYDGVFDADSTQQEVYEAIGRPVLKDVLTGFHGCVLAYGQTGSGKTYSLLNAAEDGNIAEAGVLARLVSELFVMFASDADHVYTTHVSFCQLYNETIDDLLKPAGVNLKLTPDPEEGGWAVQDLSWYQCKNADFLMQCVANGRKNIAYAETNMNKHSSRSHSILQLRINKYPRVEGVSSPGADALKVQVFKGKLTVVDLAGSERVKKSQAEGVRLQEATKINTSLLAFGQVVQALAKKQAHVPYRDALLTKMLEDSMSGGCCTRLLVNVSPSNASANETLSTLEFGTRAMKVKVAPKATEALDPTVLAGALTSSFRDEALQGSLATIRDLEGRYGAAQGQLESASEAVSGLEQRVMDLQMEVEALKAENEEQRDTITSLEGEVVEAGEARAASEEEKGLLLKEMERLVVEMEALVGEGRRLKAENDKFQARADFLAADNEAAATRFARMETQSKEDRAAAGDLEARLAKSDREKEALAVMAAKGRQGAAALLLALRRFTDAEAECAALQMRLFENSGELLIVKMRLGQTAEESEALKAREAELRAEREALLARLETAESSLAAERKRHEEEVAEYAELNEKLQELMARMQGGLEGSAAAVSDAEARYERSLRDIGARAGAHIGALEASLAKEGEAKGEARAALETLERDAEGLRGRLAALEAGKEAAEGRAREHEAEGRALREGLVTGGVGVIKIGTNGKKYHRLIRVSKEGKVEWASVGSFVAKMALGAAPRCELKGRRLVLHGQDRDLTADVENAVQKSWADALVARYAEKGQ